MVREIAEIQFTDSADKDDLEDVESMIESDYKYSYELQLSKGKIVITKEYK